MRIIVLLNSLYTGGAEFSTLSFYQWLRAQGHEVKLVCVKKATPSFDPTQFGFDTVHYLSGKTLLKQLKDFNTLVKSFVPEVVHSVLFDANLLARMSRIFHGNFVHVESLVNEMYSEHRYADPQVTRLKLVGYRMLDYVTQLKGVDHYHANGEAVARHYQNKIGISSNRITIVPRGRTSNPFVNDSSNREKVRNELGTGNRLLLVNMARHEYQKGQDVLLDALGVLKDDLHRIQLVLVGREGKLTNVLTQKIKDYHLEACVMLLGHRSDTSSLLAAADVFVFPSRFEGLPGALIEAEAAGLPIICSSIPNNHEVAEENRNALFFPHDDYVSLAKAIQRLTTDEQLGDSMGKESLAIFRAKFGIEEIHQRMHELLKKLTKKE